MKKKLTDTFINAQKPSAKAYRVGDEQQPGLMLRVTPAGSKTFVMSYRIRGAAGTKSLSLGAYGVWTLADARKRAADIMNAASKGRDLIAEEDEARRAKQTEKTVSFLLDEYEKSITHPKRNGGPLRTADDIMKRLRRVLKPHLDRKADSLTRSDMSALLDAIYNKGHARAAEISRQQISTMYRWGLSKGYVTHNPVDGTETYGRGEPRERVLTGGERDAKEQPTPNEIKALWEWFDAGAAAMPPDCIAALRLQLCTGARIGEIGGMTAAELHETEPDADGETKLLWTLPAARSKNKRERVTPLVGLAREIVERQLDIWVKGPLFRAAMSDRPLLATDLGKALDKRKLPCAHFTSHDLRRTVATQMDEQLEIPLDTIASVLGHQRGTAATITLVRRYVRPKLDPRVEQALAAWDNRLRVLVGLVEADNVRQLRPVHA
ncbi:tyrosine-type recombinase/integrase [Chelativorans xinjiangense]|uniref:tyrosine-type recombinase/integrase n=1 Tax=Chelativorans xinjiangense TaxID=2681485 RepID=UPI001357F849|nr:integrase family protein [Chelativorans xinjiangense]